MKNIAIKIGSTLLIGMMYMVVKGVEEGIKDYAKSLINNKEL